MSRLTVSELVTGTSNGVKVPTPVNSGEASTKTYTDFAAFTNGTQQNDYLSTETFTSPSVAVQNFANTDALDVNDTSSFTGTSFSVSSSGLSVQCTNYAAGPVSYRYMHGRNKIVQVAVTGPEPIIFSRFVSSTLFALVYLNSSGNITFQTNVNGTVNNAVDSVGVPGYNSTHTYQLTVKTFENLFQCCTVDLSSSSSNVIQNTQIVSSDFYASVPGSLGGLGTTSGPTVFSSIVTKSCNNFINMCCIGDSNTAGTWQIPPLLRDNGKTYVQLLNKQFALQNIAFQNHGVSGDAAYDIYNRISAITSAYVFGARNIATVLVGTNDASNKDGSGGSGNIFSPSVYRTNLTNIVTSLKNAGFEVWLMTYPPRNQNGTGGGYPAQATMNTSNLNLSQINGIIRSMSNLVNRIIPLDKYFTDPSLTQTLSGKVYQNTNINYLDFYNVTSNNGYIHFNETGQALIASSIASALQASWDQNSSSETVTSGSKQVSKQLYFSSTTAADPTLNTRSDGTKIVLHPSLSASSADYAIGIGTNKMWLSVSGSSATHTFYNGTTSVLTIGDTYLLTPSRLLITSANGPSGSSNSFSNSDFGLQLSGSSNLLGPIYMNTSGLAVPAFTTRSAGTRIVLYPNTSGATVDYAIGMNTDGVWYSTGTSNSFHRFYCGTTNTVSIGNGALALDTTTGLTMANTTDASSNTAGSATLAGGLAVAKKIFIGSDASVTGKVLGKSTTTLGNTSNTVATGSFSGEFAGGLGMIGTGTGANTIYMNTSGLAAPSFTTRSAGSRIVLYPGVSGSTVDYAIGMNSDGVWYSTGLATTFHRFYCGTTNTVSIGNSLLAVDSTTALTLASTTTSTSSGTGSLRTAGGIGISNTTDASSTTNGGTFTTAGGAAIAKKLFVGTSLTVGTSTNTNNVPIYVGSTSTFDFSNGAQYGYLSTGGAGTFTQPVGAQAPVSLQCTGRVVAPEFDAISDARVKTNVQNVTNALDTILKLKPSTFNYIDTVTYGAGKQYGFLAQDLEEIIPESVSHSSGALPNVLEIVTVCQVTLSTFKLCKPLDLEQSAYLFKGNEEFTSIHDCGVFERPKGVAMLNGDKLLLYGKCVEKLYTVNYISVIPLLVKAIQELRGQSATRSA